MRPTLGFVITTYNQPSQTLFLCERLCDMFGDPPIAIHHDFSQCDLDRSRFPSSVHFVQRWLRTSWGSLSVVDAQLAALEMLYNESDPHWFTFLSTSDYPIQIAERILQELRSAEVDAFMDLRPITDQGGKFYNAGLGATNFTHPQFTQNAYYRYVAVPWLPTKLAKRTRKPVESWGLRSDLLVRHMTPFSGEITCYAGDHWFTANRRVARLYLTKTPLWNRLHRHYRSRSAPEESFYHTLMGNSAGYQVSPDNLRYTDWEGCYAHPRVLGREDLPKLLRSNKHFARKLVWDRDLLSELDRLVLAREAGLLETSSDRRKQPVLLEEAL